MGSSLVWGSQEGLSWGRDFWVELWRLSVKQLGRGRGQGGKRGQNVCRSEGDSLFKAIKGRHREGSPEWPSEVVEAWERVYTQD